MSSAPPEMQDDSTHTQHQSSSDKLDEAKQLYSYKSSTPPPSRADVDPPLDLGMEQTTTPNPTVDTQTPKNPQNSTVHCERCDRTFTRHQDLKRHLKTDPAHSEEIQAEIWECFFCGDGFLSKRADAWKRHMADIHTAEVCLLRVLLDGTMVEYNRKRTCLAISSEPPFQYDRMYNGRYFRVKQY